MSHIGVCVHTSKNNEFFNKDKKYFPDWEFFQHIPDIRQQQNIMKKKFLKKREKRFRIFFFLYPPPDLIHIFTTERSLSADRQSDIGYENSKIIYHT